MATVELDALTKIYDGGGAPAVDGLSIDIADGEFVVLVGPSGCGKSTALRMIAGLEAISDGDLRIDGDSVTRTAPQDRDIAMVFQNYALYPHMTVAKNLSYPLRVARTPKREIEERVTNIARVLEIEEFLDRKPGQLSGGQRQRVAMGRALIRQPKVFLMDEPLSNLDAKLRVYMRSEIARIQQELGITTVYVTHDQVEAMTMGHRVVVLKDGVLQQAASPQELYDHPANMFVAAFIGSPAMNLFSTTLTLQGEPSMTMGRQTIALPDDILALRPALAGLDGDQVVAGVRPDDCYDASLSPEYAAGIDADVQLTESLGSEIVVHLDAGLDAVDTGDPDLDELGGRHDDAQSLFLARFRPHSQVRVGETARVAIDVSKLHFFDPESGEAIGQ